MIHLDVCGGIGGFALGLDLILPEVETVAFIEPDAAACRVLRKHWPGTPVMQMPVQDAPGYFAHILTAGFPCQPYSTATRGRPRQPRVWHHVRRYIRTTRPTWVFLENVQREPIEVAAADLEFSGYRPRVLPTDAAELGSPSARRRWWLLAHVDHPEQPALPIDGRKLARLPQAAAAHWRPRPDRILGMAPGVSARVDRLRLLGNTASPFQVAHALSLLAARFQHQQPRQGALPL